MARSRQPDPWRRSIALEAARLMTESGVRDFQQAKRKAAARYGISDEAALPSNAEIDQALREHQALFQPERPQLLRSLRANAVDAMRYLEQFEPRLVGAVLDGSADEHTAISLHLFADSDVDVQMFLMDKGIVFREDVRRVRYNARDVREQPVLRFAADGVAYDLTVFDRDDLRQAPLDRIDDRPMRRATLATVQALVDEVNSN